MNVLLVCHGNINRSAAAEIILKEYTPDWDIKSAALKDTKGGEITKKKMRDALNELGHITDGIRSTPISLELIEWADYVLYMDNSNEKKLFSKYKPYSDKFWRLGDFAGYSKVPDPNFSSNIEDYINVVTIIENSLMKFIDFVENKIEYVRL